MNLHAIRSCTLLCPDLDAQIEAYGALGFSVLTRAPLASERALHLGLSGQFASAQLAPIGTTQTCFEFIETDQPREPCAWSALRVAMPGLVRQHLAHKGFEQLTATTCGVRGPAGETLYLCETSEANPLPTLFAAQLACQAPKLSSAFYLGLGAPVSLNAAAEFDAGVELACQHRLEFVAKHSSSAQRYGIYALTLARRGSRGQPGPARILRGPDGELIELL